MDTLVNIATFLAKGKFIMWIYTINMVTLSWYATVKEITIDGSIAVMYSAALSTYVLSKGHELYEKRQSLNKSPGESQ